MIVVAATQNKHKIKEIQDITKDFGMKVISRDEAGVPNVEIVEDGLTFEENSEKKALEIMKLCGKITIADDSGLMVDALGGEPGVYSSRYAGEEGNDLKNNQKLLEQLAEVKEEDRTARFVSVITMVFPQGEKIVARGECEGHIAFESRGEGGFGYDPLFVPVGYEKTFGQLSAEEKNRLSHRGAALQNLRNQLSKRLLKK
ncbi:MAG: XTP/dITP diphosphatase [Anaerovoracaceae bacterium]|jgi:XTP/dITP diphosphohydrolase